jgi:prepilin-type N-terminal cleavage/methylation domain-containing protein
MTPMAQTLRHNKPGLATPRRGVLLAALRAAAKPSAQKQRAFTLTEIMVVIVIIVLMLGMALPVFRAMNGSRSQEGASNQISAFLGRARSEAIGLQQVRGVAFFPDSTGQYVMALVRRLQDSGIPAWQAPVGVTPSPFYPQYSYVTEIVSGVTRYYVSTIDVPSSTSATAPDTTPGSWSECDANVVDQVDNTDLESLPQGVAAQMVCDWGPSSGGTTQKTDAYVSIGAVLFDSTGKLTNVPISFAKNGHLGNAMQLASMGISNFPAWKNNATSPPNPLMYSSSSGTTDGNLYSEFGLVLFDREAFSALGFDTIDPAYNPTGPKSGAYTAGTPSEQAEETWLDTNASPLLINRFNGTLIQGQ